MYTIKILQNRDFDALPYENIHDSMGFADRKTGTAYVRHTNIEDLQKYLVDHELEELINEHSDHEDANGLRHKKFGSALKTAGQIALPIVGTAIGGPVGGAIGGAAAGALGGGKPSQWIPASATGAGLGFLGGKVSGVKGAGLSGFIQNPISSIGNVFSGLGSGAMNMFNGGGASSVGKSAIPAMNLPFPSNMIGTMANAANSATPSVSGGGSVLSSLFGGGTGKSLLGGGLLATGLLKKYPTFPQVPGLEDLRNQVQSGGGPVNQLAMDKLSGQLNQQLEPLSAEEEAAITKDLDYSKQQELDQINSMYKSLRPGSSPVEDTTWNKDLADVNDRYSQQRAQLLAQSRRQVRGEFNSQQSQAIAQAIGANSQQMSQLTQLATLDTAQIMAQLGLDAQQAQNFKDTFSQLGTSLISSGMGLNNSPIDDYILQLLKGNK